MSLTNVQAASACLGQAGCTAMNWLSNAASTVANGVVTGVKVTGNGVAAGTKFVANGIANGALKVAQFAAFIFQQIGNAVSSAYGFTKSTASTGFNFVKAHPGGVGIAVATLALTAVLATAYARSREVPAPTT